MALPTYYDWADSYNSIIGMSYPSLDRHSSAYDLLYIMDAFKTWISTV